MVHLVLPTGHNVLGRLFGGPKYTVPIPLLFGPKPMEEPLSPNEKRRNVNHAFIGMYEALGRVGNLAFPGLRLCGGVESVAIWTTFPKLQRAVRIRRGPPRA